MLVRPLLFIVSFVVVADAYAQTAIANLSKWRQQNPVEKLYLHTDREAYTAGQTLWFKGYFLSDFIPSEKSTALYLELLNANGQLLQRKVFPAFMSESFGQLHLPETITTGSYQLRAYSPLMMNQPEFYFNKKISVTGKKASRATAKTQEPAIDLRFFPEGGNLISTLSNHVAFKAINEYGMPQDITIEIRNQRQETVTTASALHDGMGSFMLVPRPGESYHAVITHPLHSQHVPLPEATDRGITLSLKNTASGRVFRLEQLPGNETFKAAYIIGQMQNNVVFQTNLPQDKNLIGGSIQTADLLSGILHITIFNKDGLPLAQRLTLINNKEYVLPARLDADTLNTGPRKRNRFSIAFEDTVIGNFSVSVTDADYDLPGLRPQNIYSSFLLTSDLKGYIHNPSWYFTDSAHTEAAAELLMMTQGWTRFRWEDAAANTLPPPKYKDNGLISIRGRVHIEGTGRPFANRELIYFMTPRDTAQRRFGMPRFLNTDSAGRFAIDSLFFFDKMNILFSDIRGRKNKFIKVILDGDSLYRKFDLPAQTILQHDSTDEASQTKMNGAYADYLHAEGLMLGNVTVTGRIKSPLEQLEEKYASGLFAGGINTHTLDLTGETAAGTNLFEYLQGRLPGLRIERNQVGSYNISYRDGGRGGNNVTLYLDEVQTDAGFIETIPVNQIAFVKLMGSFIGSFGSGAALAVYMKKGADLNAVTESATDIVPYNGYAIIQEFYSPNYDLQPAEPGKTDHRLTLLWQPSLHLAHVAPRMPVIFYNNDRTRRFKIVAEGVTVDGRFLMLEKIINP